MYDLECQDDRWTGKYLEGSGLDPNRGEIEEIHEKPLSE
jgi:hypothetical protein